MLLDVNSSPEENLGYLGRGANSRGPWETATCSPGGEPATHRKDGKGASLPIVAKGEYLINTALAARLNSINHLRGVEAPLGAGNSVRQWNPPCWGLVLAGGGLRPLVDWKEGLLEWHG